MRLSGSGGQDSNARRPAGEVSPPVRCGMFFEFRVPMRVSAISFLSENTPVIVPELERQRRQFYGRVAVPERLANPTVHPATFRRVQRRWSVTTPRSANGPRSLSRRSIVHGGLAAPPTAPSPLLPKATPPGCASSPRRDRRHGSTECDGSAGCRCAGSCSTAAGPSRSAVGPAP
jgi:hypothetical protein